MFTLAIKADDNVKSYYEKSSSHHEGDSGIDIYAPETITINPGETKIVSMGIKCEMLKEYPLGSIHFGQAENVSCFIQLLS